MEVETITADKTINQPQIKSLLQNIAVIQKKYDDLAKITGEKFNIFSVMRAESDEVRTHSRIIAEFLNPKGLHSQGSIFLRLFFDEIQTLMEPLGGITDFDFENAQVLVEEYVGAIDKEYSEGGFIDIVIKDSKNQIVIENKIHAGDQKGQLLRYKNNYQNCKLIYLTLEGKEPCPSSYKIENGQELNLENDIMLVSYRDHVKNWIEKSLEKTHSLPIIRETLVQYLHLIKKLTNQTTNYNMNKEIVETMTNNVEACFEISQNIDAMKKYLFLKFSKKIETKFPNAEICVDEINIGICDTGISIQKENWKSHQITLDIYIAGNNFSEIIIGVGVPNQKDINISEKFKEYENQVEYLGKYLNYPKWYLLFTYDNFKNTSESNFWSNLNSQEFVNLVSDDLKKLSDITDEVLRTI